MSGPAKEYDRIAGGRDRFLQEEMDFLASHGFRPRHKGCDFNFTKYCWEIEPRILGSTRLYRLSYNNQYRYGPTKMDDVLEYYRFHANDWGEPEYVTTDRREAGEEQKIAPRKRGVRKAKKKPTAKKPTKPAATSRRPPRGRARKSLKRRAPLVIPVGEQLSLPFEDFAAA